jgi:hypothetical protein
LLVNEITAEPNIKRHLTEWTGAIVSIPFSLFEQNIVAQKAIDLIAKELVTR